MSPQALIDMASELVRTVLRLEAPADSSVSAFFRTNRGLGPRERHALAETTYEVLRRKPQLQHLAHSGFGAQERRLAVLAWQGNPEFLVAGLRPEERAWLQQVRQVALSTLAEPLRHNLPLGPA